MIEVYPTRCNTNVAARVETKGEKEGKRENCDGRQDDRSCRHAAIVLFPPGGSLCLSALDFRLSPFSSFVPYLPSHPLPRPRSSSRSPPFLFVFRGDRGPETDVRAVKNGRRRASGTATFTPARRPLLRIPLPMPPSRISLDETRFIRPTLSTRSTFLLFTTVLS